MTSPAAGAAVDAGAGAGAAVEAQLEALKAAVLQALDGGAAVGRQLQNRVAAHNARQVITALCNGSM
jgi:hypothetical protein